MRWTLLKVLLLLPSLPWGSAGGFLQQPPLSRLASQQLPIRVTELHGDLNAKELGRLRVHLST